MCTIITIRCTYIRQRKQAIKNEKVITVKSLKTKKTKNELFRYHIKYDNIMKFLSKIITFANTYGYENTESVRERNRGIYLILFFIPNLILEVVQIM